MNRQAFQLIFILSTLGIILTLFYVSHNFGDEKDNKEITLIPIPHIKFKEEVKKEPEIEKANAKLTQNTTPKSKTSFPKITKEYNWKFEQIGRVLYGFSAYYDEISESIPKIRIIGVDDVQNRDENVECIYFDEDGQNVGSTTGKSMLTQDPYVSSHVHTLAFIVCDVDYQTTLLPSFVGLKGKYSSKIRITYPPEEDENYKFQVASCIQPLHSGFEHPLDIIEWIEYHLLMGVEHFTFYNDSIGPLTSKVLQSYPQKVTVLTWNLPYNGSGIPVHGQLNAASECAHRHRNVAKYIMTFDTDEFLVPRNYTSYPRFLDHVWSSNEQSRGSKIGAVQFTTKLSFPNWPKKNFTFPGGRGENEHEKYLKNIKLISQTLFLPGGQTKFVHRPRRIIEAGVHFSQITINGTISAVVDKENFGYYFHYRACDSYFHQANSVLENGATCTNHTGIEDNTLAKEIGPVLAVRVLDKIAKLKEEFNVEL